MFRRKVIIGLFSKHYIKWRGFCQFIEYCLLHFQPFPMSFVDEQPGERGHKRWRHARTHLSRKTSPEDNLLDIFKLALAWSDPKLADMNARSKPPKPRKDEEFTRKLAEFSKTSPSNSVEFASEDDMSSDSEDSDY